MNAVFSKAGKIYDQLIEESVVKAVWLIDSYPEALVDEPGGNSETYAITKGEAYAAALSACVSANAFTDYNYAEDGFVGSIVRDWE